VTVPLFKATGIHPGQAIALTGSLYKPKPSANPGGFDFQAYLAKEGAFAGFKGRQINLLEKRQLNGDGGLLDNELSSLRVGG
jgi:competence protein ComEC